MTSEVSLSHEEDQRRPYSFLSIRRSETLGSSGSLAGAVTETQIQEISRRASDVSNLAGALTEGRRNTIEISRRGSVHRGSLSLAEDTEDLEQKKMKAVLQLMGFQKKTQKEYRWDTVTVSKPEPEIKRRFVVQPYPAPPCPPIFHDWNSYKLMWRWRT